VIHSYSKIFTLGHKALSELFLDEVVVEEKVDGSQVSWGRAEDGTLSCRSKGQKLNIDAPEKMFAKAVDTIKEIAPLLHPGWIYRGEYLQQPKHNTLAYDRVPNKYIVIFDIDSGLDDFIGPKEKAEETARIGLECVPCLAVGKYDSWEDLKKLLETPSFLGGQLVEGIVIKNYHRICSMTKDILMGKYVSEAFKEVHRGDWKDRNPGPSDIRQRIVESLRTPARWQKAVQHLKERGQLEGSPRDIGNLIKEVQQDVQDECATEIQEHLYNWARAEILRGVIRGLPEFYKERLAEQQFVKT